MTEETAPQLYQTTMWGREDVVVEGADSDQWCTPEWLLELIRTFYDGLIDLDPCSNDYSTVNAQRSYTLADDGLAQEWADRVFCNPPYSAPMEWLRRCGDMPARGGEAVALIKGDWTTGWWKKHVLTAPARCYLDMRIKYLHPGGGTTAPWGSVLVYWGPRVATFREIFHLCGEVITYSPADVAAWVLSRLESTAP